MNLVGTGMLVVVVAGLAAVLTGAVAPQHRHRAVLGAVLTCVAAAGGILAGGAALAGDGWSIELTGVLPLSTFTLSADPLSGVFLLLIGAVALASAVYSIGYGGGSRVSQTLLPLFVTTMLLVPVAANVTTFLILWELMALASLGLILTEHKQRPTVRDAALWYAAMTHAGMVAILLALSLLASGAGSESFAAIRQGASAMSPATRSLVFVLALVGFGSKAGMVPLHPWLPRAHTEAPSHVSALMSAAMVKLGLYGLIRVTFDLLGGGPRWWGVLVLALGGLSAAYGVMQALVSTDLKRLLAFSTTENMGLILIGVGASAMFAADGNRTLATVLMAAALMHALNHAGFKALLFLGAGSVLRATGLRDLDRMGGLAARMPVTTVLFGLGALGAAALPPGNGFVSEWLLLQGLIHGISGGQVPDVVASVAMPLAVGVVALTAGLGVATFVKAFGVGLLARPRSAEAAAATESPMTMRVGMVLAAAGCGVLALAPTVVVHSLGNAIAVLPTIRAANPVAADLVMLRPSGVTASMSPLLIAVLLLCGALLLGRVVVRVGRALPRRTALIWGCGGDRLSPRMEYTATSFAEPLARVLDDVLRPDQSIDITHHDEAHYLVESVSFRHQVPDRIEARLYPPLLRLATWWGHRASGIQNGSIHRYLAFGFIGLLVVLVAVGLTG